jgi:hypothetical protein
MDTSGEGREALREADEVGSHGGVGREGTPPGSGRGALGVLNVLAVFLRRAGGLRRAADLPRRPAEPLAEGSGEVGLVGEPSSRNRLAKWNRLSPATSASSSSARTSPTWTSTNVWTLRISPETPPFHSSRTQNPRRPEDRTPEARSRAASSRSNRARPGVRNEGRGARAPRAGGMGGPEGSLLLRRPPSGDARWRRAPDSALRVSVMNHVPTVRHVYWREPSARSRRPPPPRSLLSTGGSPPPVGGLAPQARR